MVESFPDFNFAAEPLPLTVNMMNAVAKKSPYPMCFAPVLDGAREPNQL